MRATLLSVLLAGAFSTAPAQDIGVLNQNFRMHHDQWSWGDQQDVAYSQAVYDFTLGMPVATYRLGALALSGSLVYSRAAYGHDSDSAVGIQQYGAQVSLFPYRPFRLKFDFQRSQTPDLLGSGTSRGDTMGVSFGWRGRTLQDMNVSYRRGDTSGAGVHQTWTQWSLTGRQQIQKTYATLEVNRDTIAQGAQDAQGQGSAPAWVNTRLYARTDTPLTSQDWLRTYIAVGDAGGTRQASIGADLSLARSSWNSITTVSLRRSTFETSSQNMAQVAQSLAWTKDRWSVFGSLAGVSASASGLNSSRSSSAVLGGSYALSPTWRVASDASLTSTSGVAATGPSADFRGSLVLHAGIYRDGDLPAVLKQVLFGLSDLVFQHRVREDYPPGYFPSELAQQMVMRRVRQSGGIGFTADVWHLKPRDANGSLDWAKVTGDLRVNHHIHFLAIGDWRIDKGYQTTGQRQDERRLYINGAYGFGASSLNAFMGSSRSESRTTGPLGSLDPFFPGGLPELGNTTYYGTGFNSRLGRAFYGVSWTRNSGYLQGSSSIFSGYASMNFRRVSVRVRYEQGQRWDGIINKQISFDLSRAFDSVAVWGTGPE
ncbi:MAG: hypothetical protein IPP78_00920 [Holophagaceae bacterium]|nr:hypothetical protein [Holophagaceae bacterium]